MALARSSARLVPEADVDTEAHGISRLGGRPDLPAGCRWPTGANGPLSFVAQINLVDATAVLPTDAGLPRDGLLSFFYDAVTQTAWGFDPSDREAWAVHYTAADETVKPRAFPSDLPEEGRFSPIGLTAIAELTFPAGKSFEVEQIGIANWWSTYGRVLGNGEGSISRLLGNPDPVQGDMQRECQLASNGIYCGGGNYTAKSEAQELLPGSADWRLLLQVDSFEEETGMMWGDVGRLYYWVTEHDLRSHEWSNAWMILQCG